MSDHASGMSSPEAEQLWNAYCRTGDLAALQRLYEALHPEVLRYCRSVFGDLHFAEDVAQAAFARLLARRPAIRTCLRHLLLSTARNIGIDQLRKRSVPPVLRRQADGPSDPGDRLEAEEEVAALRECLAQLGERDRSLIVLTAAMGRSHRAAAEILDWQVPDHTISRRIKSLKRRLLRCLQKKGIFSANSG